MRLMMSVGTLVLALGAGTAFAQQPPVRPGDQPMGQKATPKMTDDKKMSDQHFVMDAANAGMAEVELGKLAADKAASSDVKKFGQRMADEHGKANDELKTLAQSKNITLPTMVDAKHKAVMDRLSKLSGESFDRAYMQEMVKGHQKVASDFRMEAKSGKDPDVKAWASKTLPTIEEHLKIAQDTNRAVGTSGTMPKK